MALPFPPASLMRTVGSTDTSWFDNPTGADVFHAYGRLDYSSVFDFGCGCGRLARQLLQQKVPPRHYVGIDLNRDAVDWCQQNLARPGFSFHHVDLMNRQFNPGGAASTADFPAEDSTFTLAAAWSVFTHILEPQVDFFLAECARVLQPGGHLLSTWFMFDKAPFPMMQSFQNALYINTNDLTNAVIYDRQFVLDLFEKNQLGIVAAFPPAIRGFQWVILAEKGAPRRVATFPDDVAPVGLARPPA